MVESLAGLNKNESFQVTTIFANILYWTQINWRIYAACAHLGLALALKSKVMVYWVYVKIKIKGSTFFQSETIFVKWMEVKWNKRWQN